MIIMQIDDRCQFKDESTQEIGRDRERERVKEKVNRKRIQTLSKESLGNYRKYENDYLETWICMCRTICRTINFLVIYYQ